MKILSVSTATNHLSVALNEDQQVIVEKMNEMNVITVNILIH